MLDEAKEPIGGQEGPSPARRLWSDAEKRRIVAESYQPGISVSVVARRHDLNTNQLFAWRRQFRELAGDVGNGGFVPVAREHPDRVFTSLHHLIDIGWMSEAYRRTRKDGATGIDGVTAADYLEVLRLDYTLPSPVIPRPADQGRRRKAHDRQMAESGGARRGHLA